MTEFLLILHFIGLGMGFASSFGNFFVLLTVQQSPPEAAPYLVRVQPKLARLGQVGLAILLVTGPLLLWLKFDGMVPDWTMFSLKLASVAALTAMVVLLDITARKARVGRDMVAFARLPIFGRIAATFLLLTVVFAVLAFN